MKHLIQSSAFGPDTLTVVFSAFDRAWETIGHRVGGYPAEVEHTRTELAEVLLSVAYEGCHDVDWLVMAALHEMEGAHAAQLNDRRQTRATANAGQSRAEARTQ